MDKNKGINLIVVSGIIGIATITVSSIIKNIQVVRMTKKNIK